MSARYQSYRLSRPGRRIVSGLALVAYLVSVVGFPLPMPASQDASTPFPCQHHQCGCNSAEQCWRNCCCFTPQERLTWARRHNVVIPADIRAELEHTPHDDEHDDHHDDHAGSCCQSSADHDCGHTSNDEQDCSQCRTPDKPRKLGWVSGWQAQKCQGLTMLWASIGVSLPLEITALWEFDWAVAGQICTASHDFSPWASLPAVPPPRA